MGYGLPAAIGAKVAMPDAVVVDIDGDASFNMTLTELSTAVQFNIGVKIIILNNEEQGMVTQWQSLFYEDRFSWTHQQNPDFVKLAEAMGLKGMRVSKVEEVPGAIAELLAYDGPVLLEVVVDVCFHPISFMLYRSIADSHYRRKYPCCQWYPPGKPCTSSWPTTQIRIRCAKLR